jgi:hypothetical protein
MTLTRSSRATRAQSAAPGILRLQPTPKGLSVRARTSRMAARHSSGDMPPEARMPSPPASLTAATSCGTAT